MSQPAGELGLVGAEEPSRHRVDEAGMYLVAIRLKPKYNFDDYLLIDSPVYITQGANNLISYSLSKQTTTRLHVPLRLLPPWPRPDPWRRAWSRPVPT
jgi:hypothetical protein